MENEELNQLLYEALETELGGVKVYEQAIQCAVNEDLKTEWEEYLEQTTNHVKIVRDMFERTTTGNRNNANQNSPLLNRSQSNQGNNTGGAGNTGFGGQNNQNGGVGQAFR